MQSPTPGQVRAARAALTGVVLLALLAVVALASRSGFGHNNTQAAPSASYVSYAMTLLLIVVVLLIPVTLYLQFLRLRERGIEERQSLKRRLLGPLILLLTLAALSFLIEDVYRRGHLRVFHPPGSGRAGAGSGAARKPLPGVPVEPRFEWIVLWIAVAAVVVATVAVIVWSRTRPQPPPRGAEDEPALARDLALSIEGAIGDLEAEPDARRAVIAAYARMEGVLARNGLRRRPSETPLEYLRHVLDGLTTRGDAVARLTRLFEEAKFSRHEIGPPEKRAAIAALHEIRADLQPGPA